jgi:2,4-dienoyl-CoA reductase-like NADH-dependent reductase (Old Yellow Enzyme family)
MEQWLQPLVDAGADVLHCSQRRFWEPEFEGSDLNFAGWAQKLTGVPCITVGSIGLSGEFVASYGGEASVPTGIDALIARMERGEFAMAAVGRALIADPQWLQKMRNGDLASLRGFDRSLLATLE